MVGQFTRYSLVLIIGLVVSMPALAGPRQTAGTDTLKPLAVLQVDEPAMLPGDMDGVVDLADRKSPIETVQERYPNGKLKIRREVTRNEQGDYILHGEWQMWDKQGNLIASGQYRNNRRHGTWTRVHSGKGAKLFSRMPYKTFRGPFTSEATFKDGELHGKWIISDNEHRKISQWEYANGVRQGVSVWNYASGHVMTEIVFRDALIDGYLRRYDKDSKLIEDGTYQLGRKLALKVGYYKAGKKKKKWEGIYLHAKLVIDSVDDWWNAKPVEYTTVGKDVKHGRWTAWHPNGQMRVRGTYEHDLPEGQFTWWHPNGQEAATGNYKNGQAHGVWVWWHKNGQKSANGQYTDGVMSGSWSHWEENGRLCRKSDFSTITDSVVAQPEETQEIDDPQTETSRVPVTKKSVR